MKIPLALLVGAAEPGRGHGTQRGGDPAGTRPARQMFERALGWARAPAFAEASAGREGWAGSRLGLRSCAALLAGMTVLTDACGGRARGLQG